jgi:hypothetical protein
VASTLRLALLWCVPLLRLLPFRRRTITREGAPYLTRIYLTPSTGRLGQWWRARFRGHFLHHFHSSDPDTLHNHPWQTAESTILRGGYIETRRAAVWSNDGYDVDLCNVHLFRWPGDRLELSGADWHRVDLLEPDAGCWSYFVAGKRHGYGWGFLNGRIGNSDDS